METDAINAQTVNLSFRPASQIVFEKDRLTKLAYNLNISSHNISQHALIAYIGNIQSNNIQVDEDSRGHFLFTAVASSPRKWTGFKAKVSSFNWELVYEHAKTQGIYRFALPLSEPEKELIRKSLRLRQTKKGEGEQQLDNDTTTLLDPHLTPLQEGS